MSLLCRVLGIFLVAIICVSTSSALASSCPGAFGENAPRYSPQIIALRQIVRQGPYVGSQAISNLSHVSGNFYRVETSRSLDLSNIIMRPKQADQIRLKYPDGKLQILWFLKGEPVRQLTIALRRKPGGLTLSARETQEEFTLTLIQTRVGLWWTRKDEVLFSFDKDGSLKTIHVYSVKRGFLTTRWRSQVRIMDLEEVPHQDVF